MAVSSNRDKFGSTESEQDHREGDSKPDEEGYDSDMTSFQPQPNAMDD
jgi:hypothetical protein